MKKGFWEYVWLGLRASIVTIPTGVLILIINSILVLREFFGSGNNMLFLVLFVPFALALNGLLLFKYRRFIYG